MGLPAVAALGGTPDVAVMWSGSSVVAGGMCTILP